MTPLAFLDALLTQRPDLWVGLWLLVYALGACLVIETIQFGVRVAQNWKRLR